MKNINFSATHEIDSCDEKISAFLSFHDDIGYDDIHESWHVFCKITENNEKLKKALGSSYESVKKEVLNND